MSFSAKSTDQLFNEGIAAARSQDNVTARSRFREIVSRDDQSEKGWLWLASVLDDKDEKRAGYGKVLQINPDNQSAKREMMALLRTASAQTSAQNTVMSAGDANSTSGEGSNPSDAADSGSKRRATPLRLAALVALLVLVLVVAVIKFGGGGSNSAAAASTAALTAGSPMGTAAGTQAVTAANGSTVATVAPNASAADTSGNATPGTGVSTGSGTIPSAAESGAAALTASTAAPVNSANSDGTRIALALNNTLPPTWTPPASATAVVQASSTPLAPPPVGLTGHLSVATGTILTTDAFLSIVSMKPDGTGIEPFVSDPDRGEYAVFTSDGKYVIYVYITSGTGSRLLRIANRDGSKPRELAAAWGGLPPLDIRSSLSLSANGRYLAFSGLSILQNESDPAIYVLDMQSFLTGKSVITPSATAKPKAGSPPAPVPGTPSATPSLADLYLTRLTAKDVGANMWPAVAPDGKTVVYTNQSPNSAKPLIELYRVAVKANSDPTPLTTDGATLMKSAPVWSADGKYLAFTSNPLDSAYSDLEIMLADGTGRHVLLHQNKVHNIRPHWSPNGKYIAFTSDRSGANEVYLVDVSTTVTYQVTNNGQTNFVTDWAVN